MANPNKIQNKPYRNWVKGALGLCYLQEGLHPFTDRVVKAEHTRILQNLTPCSSCTIKSVLPHHAKGKICIHKSKAKCNCRQNKNKACITCGNFYDEIIVHHRYRDPNWDTDCSSWYTDHWQFAKCFLTTANQSSGNTAAETDAAGLLSIIINGLFFQTEIQCNIDPPNDVFSQVRAFRNEILHDAKLEMTDNEVTRYLTAMITVLQDKKTLTNDQSAKAAVKKLKKIINDDLVITTTEENKAVQIALDAITKAKEQAEESIKELVDAKTAESVGEIQSSVSAEFDTRYEPELKKIKLSHDDHENRIKAVERALPGIEEIKERLLQLENQVSSLKRAEELNKKRSDFLKQKQDLQQYLVNQYQTHNVKTWVSPLMTQYNNVNIEDVYVPPDLVVEEKDENMVNTADDTEKKKSWQNKSFSKKPRDSGNLTQTKERHLSRYRDLFKTNYTKNKNIYVIGDVGTGKSSFCKMMLRNWCISVTSGQGNLENQSGLADDQNYQDMNEFEFLFYIPLRNMTANSDILGMIKAQFLDYETLLDEIFVDNSASCLILLDGLDEWSSPKMTEMVLKQDSHGIPASISVRNATIITTSRPSARGILDMKSSECDLRVMLLGIREESIELMIEKYMRLISDDKSISDKVLDCTNKLSDVECDHLHQTPMLLQQMIWMYCHGYEIGKSITYNYVNIVNMLFAWLHDKVGKTFTLDKNNQIRDFQLPKLFDKYVRCQENRKLIMLLGKVAFDTFVTEEGTTVVFGRSKLKQLGLSDDDISIVLKYGIFVEENSYDPTYEKSQISFTHTSFLEFFTAVFIACSYHSNATSFQSEDDVLEKLVSHQLSTAGVLRIKNVLIMICGLTPFLTKRVFDCIYQAKERGVIMQNEDDLCGDYDITYLIRSMCFQCLSECDYSEQLTSSKGQTCLQVKLHDIRVYTDTGLELYLSKVIPTCVQTFDIFCCVKLSHDQCLSLSSFLSQTVSLRTLIINDIVCTNDDCKGHSIDLSNHTQLSMLSLQGLNQFTVSGGHKTHLETCEIINCKLPHDLCSSLVKFMSQAVSLRTLRVRHAACTKADCQGHSIDISNSQLSSLYLYGCNQICVSGGNITHLETCEIVNCRFSHDLWSSLTSFLSQAVSLKMFSMRNVSCGDKSGYGDSYLFYYRDLLSDIDTCRITNCKLPHDVCASLSSYLSQAKSIRMLHIESFACTKDDCQGHCIDISNHTKLSSLSLSRCNQICVSGGNSTHLETCQITACKFSHDIWPSVFSFLSQTVSLKQFTLKYVSCEDGDCQGHCIDLSNQKQLSSLYLHGSTQFTVSGGHNAHFETCEITDCKLSHDLCSSLTKFMSQAVSLRTLRVRCVACTKGDCIGHGINISNHTQLSSLFLHGCSQICVRGGNSTPLETCEITDCKFSHDLWSSVSLFLSQTVSLKQFSLKYVSCEDGDCQGHCIDLSNHTQLSSLHLHGCPQMCVSGGKNTHLETYEIINCKFSHGICLSISSFLSQTVSLKQFSLKTVSCEDGDCKGHCIDLSNHKQLSSLYLHGSTQFTVSGGHNAHLETCEITDCKLSHNLCSSLTKFMSQAVSLRTLRVRRVACTKGDCIGHGIFLSNHTQLSSLFLHECNHICVSGGNYPNLERCEIADCCLSHDLWSSLTSFLSQAVSLNQFSMRNVSCDKSECKARNLYFYQNMLSCSDTCRITHCKLPHDVCASLSSFLSQAGSFRKFHIEGVACTNDDCEGHSIDISNHSQLSSLYLYGCNQICVSGGNITHLETCEIVNCGFSHDLWLSLTSFLSQAVSLKKFSMRNVSCGDKSDYEDSQFHHKDLLSEIDTCRITNCKLPHDVCESLSSFLSQAGSFRKFHIEGFACTKDDCEGHSIDISNHTKLSTLSLSGCNQICVSGRNNTHLETCAITACKFSHDIWSSVLSFLSKTVSLEDVSLENVSCENRDCKGHCIDISNHTQLSSLYLYGCSQISVSGGNNTHLETCMINACKFSHDIWPSVSSFLSQTVSLEYVSLVNVSCENGDCKGHCIDISNHTQLSNLHLHGCSQICVSGGNSTHLETCQITDCKFSHDLWPSVLSFLAQTVSLKHFSLQNISCEDGDCQGHCIDLSNQKQLSSLYLHGSTQFTVSGGHNAHLETCEITDCKLSHNLCSSLTQFMSQAVSLRTLRVRRVACTKGDCNEHGIDLSNYTQLSSLYLQGFDQICVPGGNISHLENCEIAYCCLSHELWSLLTSILSQSASIKAFSMRNVSCDKSDCEGNYVFPYQHLSSHIGSCRITNCKLPHDVCASLSSFLSQAVSFSMFHIEGFACTKADCQGHSIDLSNHTQLSSLYLHGCNQICVSGVNISNLETCDITDCKLPHDLWSALSSFLSQTKTLRKFSVKNSSCVNSDCKGHCIDLTNHEQMSSLFSWCMQYH